MIRGVNAPGRRSASSAAFGPMARLFLRSASYRAGSPASAAICRPVPVSCSPWDRAAHQRQPTRETR